ncbi:glycosyltransferase [Reichenbachiella sp. MALMAid0571]|uniref:glycosyltransferase n=1 Tax=Reichenbachiella sp. MALMAid0571 TaxID=3143939 RepID=UPI0032DFBFB3
MKILFLAPYPPGQAPSQRFRFEQYFLLLKKHTIEYSFQSFLDEKTWQILYLNGNTLKKVLGIAKGFMRRTILLFSLSKYDEVFIHREVTPIGPPIFEWIIAKLFKKEIIFDFDDAIWLPNTSKENVIVSVLKWHSKTESICKWSKTISVGNPYLAQYAGQFSSNVVVNPTTIDTEHLHVPVGINNKIPVIGWTGTHSTGKYLASIISALNEVSKTQSFKFLYVSNKTPDFEIPNLEFVKWMKESEIDQLNHIDIGIMPLEDDQWSEGKCGFKALQYMALEIPALVSPVGVNSTIVDDGVNGYHCKSEADWVVRLTELIENPEWRRKMGAEGRKKVIAQYSVKSNSENFLKIVKG